MSKQSFKKANKKRNKFLKNLKTTFELVSTIITLITAILNLVK